MPYKEPFNVHTIGISDHMCFSKRYLDDCELWQYTSAQSEAGVRASTEYIGEIRPGLGVWVRVCCKTNSHDRTSLRFMLKFSPLNLAMSVDESEDE